MKDLVSELAAWDLEAARVSGTAATAPPARAVVVRTFGSAPRPGGCRAAGEW